jgi:hypothetical protein
MMNKPHGAATGVLLRKLRSQPLQLLSGLLEPCGAATVLINPGPQDVVEDEYLGIVDRRMLYFVISNGSVSLLEISGQMINANRSSHHLHGPREKITVRFDCVVSTIGIIVSERNHDGFAWQCLRQGAQHESGRLLREGGQSSISLRSIGGTGGRVGISFKAVGEEISGNDDKVGPRNPTTDRREC